MKEFFKILTIIGIIILTTCLIKEIYSHCIGIEKVAISEKTIKNEPYIICNETLVTGFEWVMLTDEEGQEYTPFKYVVLKGEALENVPSFASAAEGGDENVFVFYIKGKQIEYDDVRGEHLVYFVDDWDIIYPVKRIRLFSFLESRRYITYNDLPLPLKKQRMEQRKNN